MPKGRADAYKIRVKGFPRCHCPKDGPEPKGLSKETRHTGYAQCFSWVDSVGVAELAKKRPGHFSRSTCLGTCHLRDRTALLRLAKELPRSIPERLEFRLMCRLSPVHLEVR